MSYPGKFFPFTRMVIGKECYTTSRVFQAWFEKGRGELNAKYGGRVLTSNGYEKRFGFYEVDIEVLNESEAEIVFYDMYDSFEGGRGNEILRLGVTKSEFDFSDLINQEIDRYVGAEHRKRAELEEQRKRHREKQAILAELFAGKPYNGDLLKSAEETIKE